MDKWYNTIHGTHVSDGMVHFVEIIAILETIQNETLDIPPKPFDKWILNDLYLTHQYHSYGALPITHRWDESTTSWVNLILTLCKI